MNPEHGMPVCTHQSHKYDTACFTQCDPGYALDRMMFSICQNNSLWSTNLPDCEGLNLHALLSCIPLLMNIKRIYYDLSLGSFLIN